MPTPLMPDEEFDAQFRLGLEHYPEQPEDPAAWHRMELLLDADLRQQALRRRVWRLLGAEAVLLVLGVWAAFFLLLEKIPLSAGQPPLATTGRAAGAASSASSERHRFVGAAGRAIAEADSSASLALRHKQPAIAAQEASQLSGHSYAAASKLSTVGKSTILLQSISSSANVALRRSSAASRARGARSMEAEKSFVARHNSTLRATGTSPLRRARTTVLTGQVAVSEATIVATNRVVEANHKLAFYQGKRRLHQSAGATARDLSAAAGRRKTLPTAVTASPEKAIAKASHLRSLGNRHAAPQIANIRNAASASLAPFALPIDLLAPRWPASGLRCQLPDSLALIALSPTHPTDSLDQPRPRPLLSAYRFRLGLVGAPELSTVRADRLVKPGSSLGVVLEYQLGRRWRMSAGYLYTNKIYVARGTDYTLPAGYTLPHGYVISNVDAACRIVDIPLNLRYDLWQRPRYQVFASVGLSSLLMRREQYTYDYELVYGKPVAPYSWELDNGSQHVLKVLNLSAGYERAVGQRWTVQAEPFVKLPLAGVGFGAVRLSSAGVFFSLKYGLLPVHPAPAPH